MKNGFDEGQWSMEFRPIIDKKSGAFYWAINPTLDWWFKGPQAGTGLRGRLGQPEREGLVGLHRQDHRRIRVLRHDGFPHQMAPVAQQQHVLYPAIDLNLSPDWEVNFGYGFGLAGNGDHNIVKLILGRRLKF